MSKQDGIGTCDACGKRRPLEMVGGRPLCDECAADENLYGEEE